VLLDATARNSRASQSAAAKGAGYISWSPSRRPAHGCEPNRCDTISGLPAKVFEKVSLCLYAQTTSRVHNSCVGLSVETKRTERPGPPDPQAPTSSQPARRCPHLTQLPPQAGLRLPHRTLSNPTPVTSPGRRQTNVNSSPRCCRRHSLSFASFFACFVPASALFGCRRLPDCTRLYSISAGLAPLLLLCPRSPGTAPCCTRLFRYRDTFTGTLCRTFPRCW
jgi:hypothetical protein